MLPVLVILFVISYSLLTALVFEQGQTIQSQRGLIREMLKDSTQLATLKGKLARDDGKRAHDKESVQTNKDADTGNGAAATKKGAGVEKGTKPPGKSARTMKTVPNKPAADLEDVRRFTGVI
jgi:hypothetical protein